MKTLAERLWARVDTSGGPDACWPWMGYRMPKGYGQIRVGGQGGTAITTHRLALELALGRPLGPGEMACHTCDNPPCCNARHLFAGTAKHNTEDAVAKGRMHPGERHGMARLTGDQVRAIRARVAAGEPHAPLAAEFRVSSTTISDVARRRSWKHI